MTRSTLLAAGIALLLLAQGEGHAQQAAPAPNASDDDAALRAMRRRMIHVTGAELSAGAHHCDVTEIVRKRCEARDRCAVEVNSSLCATEALPGLIHVLTIHYSCHAGSLTTSATEEEPRSLQLSCGQNRFGPG